MGSDQTYNMQNYERMNKQDIYSTKEYYDYYHSLKPRDPRLPKPTYQEPTVDVEVFKSYKKQSEQTNPISKAFNQSDDFEKKMSSLTLEDQLSNNSQNYDYS